MGADHRKLTQALNWLARTCGKALALERVKGIKLLYLADRYHLRRYGRLVTEDGYLAMPYGPVGSLTKELTDDSNFLRPDERAYARQFLRPKGEHRFVSLKRVDKSVFSETDLEALEFAARRFGHLSWNELAEFTHLFPEWKRHEKEAQEKGAAVAIDCEDFFKDPSPDEPLYGKYRNQAEAFQGQETPSMVEIYREWRDQAKLWG